VDTYLLQDALRRYVTTDEPPLRTTVAATVAAGRRYRRNRAVTGGLAAVAALTLAGAVLAQAAQRAGTAHPAAPPTHLLPAECAAEPPPGDTGRRLRVTCFLYVAVPQLLPTSTFEVVNEPDTPPGARPLTAYQRKNGPGLGADALVRDREGVGMLLVTVMPADGEGPPTEKACSSDACQLRTGPHGEQLAVYHKHPAAGSDSYSVYAYTGGTVVVAVSANHTPTTEEATRTAPPLNVEDLVALACASELVVF
jgi:hypothetical protein